MSAPAPPPGDWESDVVLLDGGTARIRPARADDAERIHHFHRRLSKETVYLRFFSAMRELPARLLERFTRADPGAQMTLLALVSHEVVAMASYHRTEGTDDAEVAFVVHDAHHGRGLATLLLEHLAEIARQSGIRRFTAETLPHNRKMLEVFRDAGYPLEHGRGEGVVRVAFALDETPAVGRAVARREHLAEAHSVARLLAPRSIAVVGASETPGKVGHAILRNLVEAGFAGALHPVNRSRKSVLGLPAYPSVSALPGRVDLAVVAVPAPDVAEVVQQCAERQVHGVVVISAGFAETGGEGARLERELVALVRAHGMRLVGPNCFGVANTADDVRMNATFAPVAPAPGRVGLLSQSGALGIVVLGQARELGLGISTFVSVGNKADISANDLLQYWADDPATDVILLYLESFGNPRKFARLARSASRRKPIVAVKSGRTSSGTRAASSHTAAMASPDVAVDALFAQAGVVRVDTLGQLFDTARVLAQQPLPAGRRVAIVGNSGGPGIMAADACERSGLEVPELSPRLRAALRDVTAEAAAVANPVDLMGTGTPEQYERVLERVLASDEVDAVIVLYTPPVVTHPEEIAAAVERAARGAGEKTLLACFLAGEDAPGRLGGDAPGTRRIPTFPYPEAAAQALARAADYAAWRRRPRGRVPAHADVDRARADRIVRAVLARTGEEGGWLAPDECAALLASYRIPLVEALPARSPEEAAEAARRLGGRVVLKAAAPDLVHKSDVGGVALGLDGPEAARAAFESMAERLGASMGGAVVQPMQEGGVETIVGVVQDPSFGPLLLFGLGGVTTELLGDRAFRILPLTDRDASELVRSIRGAPLLFGFRGRPPVRVEALEALLLRVACLAEEVPELVEMDLNPVMVSPEGALAVDARLRLAPYAPRPERAWRRLR